MQKSGQFYISRPPPGTTFCAGAEYEGLQAQLPKKCSRNNFEQPQQKYFVVKKHEQSKSTAHQEIEKSKQIE